MNIQVNNLDNGYKQCEELNSLASNSGTSLISKLEETINNLKEYWKGSDATVHINHLITVYDALVAIVTDAKSVTSSAGDAMIAMQKVRNGNGGEGSIGSELSAQAPNADSIKRVEGTDEYSCRPEANIGRSTLSEVCKEYNTFTQEFQSQKDGLLSNWTAGCNWEQAKDTFDKFQENTDDYYTYLTDAYKDLDAAVNNILKIGD